MENPFKDALPFTQRALPIAPNSLSGITYYTAMDNLKCLPPSPQIWGIVGHGPTLPNNIHPFVRTD